MTPSKNTAKIREKFLRAVSVNEAAALEVVNDKKNLFL